MKFLDEFRNGALARRLLERIAAMAKGSPLMRFMEVCGTHTMAIYRSGIRQLLPENIVLISGPGCPVCVTANQYIDQAIAYARLPGVIVCTFGDMVRVPGSSSSLEVEKGKRVDVRVVYSALDALEVARQNPGRRVVFLGVGFETTVPTVAAAIAQAAAEGLRNFFVSSAHKVMPPALTALTTDGRLEIDGFILPGHVSAIIGVEPYQFIAGFEPLDILQGLLMLVKQVREGRPTVEIEYSRVVRPEGNPRARALMGQVFCPCDAEWRGMGVIPASGLALRPEYEQHNAEANLEVSVEPPVVHPACRCGEVLRGLCEPPECPLFASACTPETPVGACMVSTEGTCAASYKYGRRLEPGADNG